MRDCGLRCHIPFHALPLILALLCLAGLTGCGSGSSWKPGEPLARERIKIGVIHPNDITQEAGYDYAQYMGILRMQQELGLEDGQIIRKLNIFDKDRGETENAMLDCINKGANIIIAPSWGYAGVCEKLAGQFPRVIFAHGMSTLQNGANLTSFSPKFYQSRYLSGIVAGKKTGTNRIGYVAAMDKDNGEVSGGLDAFAIGVESVNPAARVYVRVTHSWFDPMGETEAADKLIASGCDVITGHTNTPAILEAAKKAGVWGIGYNSNMEAVAPGTVLTSVVINWEVYYIRLVRSIIDGDFTTRPYFGGIAEGMTDITPPSPELVPPGTIEAVREARQRIIEGFNVFGGAFETNQGLTMGSEGLVPAEGEILENIHWYYRNVVEQ